jgi:hypothetical protein
MTVVKTGLHCTGITPKLGRFNTIIGSSPMGMRSCNLEIFCRHHNHSEQNAHILIGVTAMSLSSLPREIIFYTLAMRRSMLSLVLLLILRSTIFWVYICTVKMWPGLEVSHCRGRQRVLFNGRYSWSKFQSSPRKFSYCTLSCCGPSTMLNCSRKWILEFKGPRCCQKGPWCRCGITPC